MIDHAIRDILIFGEILPAISRLYYCRGKKNKKKQRNLSNIFYYYFLKDSSWQRLRAEPLVPESFSDCEKKEVEDSQYISSNFNKN